MNHVIIVTLILSVGYFILDVIISLFPLLAGDLTSAY